MTNKKLEELAQEYVTDNEYVGSQFSEEGGREAFTAGWNARNDEVLRLQSIIEERSTELMKLVRENERLREALNSTK